MQETPLIMVLVEETPDRATFRFEGTRWAVATLVPGLVLVAVAGKLLLTGKSLPWVLILTGVFGLALIYSSVYSATASQWLVADRGRRTVTYHRRNLYGQVHWERPAQEFQGLFMGHHRVRDINWQIILRCQDGEDLYLGESIFGAMSLDRALAVAAMIGDRTGIPVQKPVV